MAESGGLASKYAALARVLGAPPDPHLGLDARVKVLRETVRRVRKLRSTRGRAPSASPEPGVDLTKLGPGFPAMVVTLEGGVVSASEEAARLLGHPVEAVCTMSILALIDGSNLVRHRDTDPAKHHHAPTKK